MLSGIKGENIVIHLFMIGLRWSSSLMGNNWFNWFLVLFLLSAQVLSITPKTQEQVEILRNVSTYYDVK